ncbi:sporulation transcriptional regulator SpoIIID [Merdimmobilis hominis]|uniref:Stage III sporulation protein D n=1 Tax=uncultured Anaerotruncus sp. TaxID=905011 RepID=A0A6N2UG74_9FIRM|nr:sporulation transcriptional regulator SpoIIID [Merdimmobilis hominis]MCD4835317.1 sporulation transcriptional regulator SpoIIID [Merdimmobilis hominis]PWL56852.1 MAG: sporulation transcriptional regulator SpoIIID [Oscillospiraceae bacterium]PWL62852.1 MAG: sporulation transcriptional regulator SpoIIID [Oscillospiraceae bacterium]
MKGLPEERAITLGNYIIEHDATVRQAAKEFNISKSTVHKDVSERLKAISPQLYQQVKQVLEKNKSERHIRGGMATKSKYERLKERESKGR